MRCRMDPNLDATVGIQLLQEVARYASATAAQPFVPTSTKFCRGSYTVGHLAYEWPVISGQQLSIVVGHVAGLFLLRRELLSVLSSVYQFLFEVE